MVIMNDVFEDPSFSLLQGVILVELGKHNRSLSIGQLYMVLSDPSLFTSIDEDVRKKTIHAALSVMVEKGEITFNGSPGDPFTTILLLV